MQEAIICAGFGGQGIMLLGKVMAQAALKEDKYLSWFPSYGAAMRGGTAFCMVNISRSEIASAYIDKCDTLIAFNQPSWEKFKQRVKRNGRVFLNSTLIEDKNPPRHLKIYRIPYTEIASHLGNVRVTNMVALGSYLKATQLLKTETVLQVFSEIVPKDKAHLLQINQQALEKGYNSL